MSAAHRLAVLAQQPGQLLPLAPQLVQVREVGSSLRLLQEPATSCCQKKPSKYQVLATQDAPLCIEATVSSSRWPGVRLHANHGANDLS